MAKVESKLVRMQKDKDGVLEASRGVVRAAGKAITLVHAGKMGEAGSLMRRLSSADKRLRQIEKGFGYFAIQAHQEYVEALAFYSFVKERKVVSIKDAGTGEIPYLLGMLDAVGELKRAAIEAIREGDGGTAEACYSLMKAIYDSTRTMRFANSIVPEFRRKQDTARMQIEGLAVEMIALGARRKGAGKG